MTCTRCGAANPAHANFCLECGLDLRSQAPGARVTESHSFAGDGAERRQLTCLFSDLENSVQLSERLDPEQLREVLAAYQKVCATVIRRFDGHIARYFGDGILVYFGFPGAHEDDAQRAVLSGVGMVEGVRQLNARLERERGIGLHVRIGIHTGLVVAGDIAPGEALETMAAIGETPNIAARLQALAAPDSVVISAATYRLIAGYFNCEELGFRTLRGISQPMAIYRVLHESGARTRLDVAALGGLSPMKGRDADLQLMTERWHRACDRHGSGVLVVGEPGIGKSRLLWALQEHVAQSPSASLARLTCSPYFQNTAFFPLAELYARDILQFGQSESADQRLDKIEGYLAQYGFPLQEYGPIVADLLSVPHGERYPARDLPADRRRQLTMQWIVQTVLIRAEQQPLLLVVEDLHWIDPSSLDVVVLIIEQLPRTRLLLVMSTRPEFSSPWKDGQTIDQLTLNRLDQVAAADIVNEVAGGALPRELLQHLLGKADGVPLYLEELTKLVFELGLLQRVDDHFELTRPIMQVGIPATLAGSLTARLDRLGEAKGLAQLGATIGRRFSYRLLKLVLATMAPVDEGSLSRDLERLAGAGLIVAQDASAGVTYTFKHALIQDVAYESLLHTTRQVYHERIARVLAETSASSASEAAPELVAHHYTEANLIAEALPWWLKAGRRALHASAYQEAIAHLRTGLQLLPRLPDGPERMGLELEFRLAIGPALMATLGYGATQVEECYQRARELCADMGNPPQLAPVLYGLWTYHVVRAQFWTALELGEQILSLGVRTNDDALLLQGNTAIGWAHFFHGHLAEARTHLTAALELYSHDRHYSNSYTFGDNPATSAGGALACTLWLSGYPDQAMARADKTLQYLRTLDHPYSIAFGLDVIGIARQYTGDGSAIREVVEEAIAVSNERSLPLTAAMGIILRGWARTRQGELREGIAEIHQGIELWTRTGAELGGSYWYCLLAEAYSRAGDAQRGLEYLTKAELAVNRTDERFLEAEVHRLRGKLLASDVELAPAGASETEYLVALELAKKQGARLLHIRAAVGLARVRQAQGRLSEAYACLAESYAAFTEGFGTQDLLEAGQLLAELEQLRAPASLS